MDARYAACARGTAHALKAALSPCAHSLRLRALERAARSAEALTRMSTSPGAREAAYEEGMEWDDAEGGSGQVELERLGELVRATAVSTLASCEHGCWSEARARLVCWQLKAVRGVLLLLRTIDTNGGSLAGMHQLESPLLALGSRLCSGGGGVSLREARLALLQALGELAELGITWWDRRDARTSRLLSQFAADAGLAPASAVVLRGLNQSASTAAAAAAAYLMPAEHHHLYQHQHQPPPLFTASGPGTAASPAKRSRAMAIAASASPSKRQRRWHGPL